MYAVFDHVPHSLCIQQTAASAASLCPSCRAQELQQQPRPAGEAKICWKDMGLQKLQLYGLLVEVVRKIVTCSQHINDTAMSKLASNVCVQKWQTLCKQLSVVEALLSAMRDPVSNREHAEIRPISNIKLPLAKWDS